MSFSAFNSKNTNNNNNNNNNEEEIKQEALQKSRAQAKDYLSKENMDLWQQQLNKESGGGGDDAKNKSRAKHGLLPASFHTHDEEQEKRIAEYIEKHKTWRSNVYLLRSLEYWQLRADYYPYVKRADKQHEDFFIRGITVHPRLSDYPMCKAVIRDYFTCRDYNPVLQIFNACAPLKEQFCSCINEVFVKNHKRGDKKFNSSRDKFFSEQKERRFTKLKGQVEESIESKTKLQD